jgi:acyl-CoA synthetase (AMP-forming)/AMP-acid ligase II
MPDRTLVDVARRRAQSQPDARAYTFLTDGEAAEQHLTYGDLDRAARAIAARLQAEGDAGERALVCCPPGLEYVAAFFGCLYAGVLPVPVYPPRPGRPPLRLESLARDARPRWLLAPSSLARALPVDPDSAPTLAALRRIATDAVPGEGAAAWRETAPPGDAVAFLQYTSGSTRAPRGVMVSHANLMHNLGLIREAFGHTAGSRGVIWLPPYHDMGLIGGVLQPLFAGFPVVLMSPLSFLQRPLRWLQAVSRYRATTSGGPNFAYELCLERIVPEQRAGLELGSWRVAFNGAEPVRRHTMERFADAFGACGFQRSAFYPCYGLAEATLWAAGRFLADAAGAPVSCGRTSRDQRVAVVDPHTRRAVRDAELGEIWISGPSVAGGYWGLPEETEATFAASLADTGEGPFLRTGDLGFLAGGELYVTGRSKDVVIIDGLNHHAEDFEWTAARSHPALAAQGGAAFAIDGDGAERLAIVHELARRPPAADLDEVIAAICAAVGAEHAVPVHAVALLRPGSLPRTTSGKVQRAACREALLSGRLEAVREWRLGDDGSAAARG